MQKYDCAIFKALGDKTRYRIMSELVRRERCACELPRLVGRAQPTVSLQLKYLSELGIVSSRRRGREVIYKVSDRRVNSLMGSGAIR
jgi:DNA-binding transcriptional ArsR family regulator